ncbi:MAG TPA: hypothetical protein VE685_14725 [Thermoanaerobaculia bacterium]|nr:hypothetical protein [Thermoanaerobaculia bacterium]
MSRQIVRLVVVCLSLVLFTAATEAAGREAAPDRGRPALVREVPSFGEMIREWIARRLAARPGGWEEGVQLKCSAGIDPDGKPCTMPTAGCRCTP